MAEPSHFPLPPDVGALTELADSPEVAGWEALWQSRLPEVTPLGSSLRTELATRWVRLWWFPDGHRGIAAPADAEQIVTRFDAVVSWLSRDAPTHAMWLVFPQWSPRSVPEATDHERVAHLTGVQPWRRLPPSADDAVTTLLSVAHMDRNDPRWHTLLCDWIATDRVADIIVADEHLRWLLHPYDGGVDVIAAEPAQREAVAAAFADAISPRPDGL